VGPRFAFLIVLMVTGSLVFAGCAGGKAKGGGGDAYKGEFREFDLFLFQVSSKGTSGWSLYPGAYVDIWGWALDEPVASKATVPGPTLRVREHDTVRVNFHIQGAPMAHTIHWHGIHVPWQMDGVPYVSQLPIGRPEFDGHGNLFTYEFQVEQSGTYWYHCHVDTAHHLDMGMYGALIVDPADPAQDPPYDREATLMLDEWDRSHAHQSTDAIAAANSIISKSGDPTITANDAYAYVRDYLIMNQFYNDTVAGNAKRVPGGVPGVRETRDWYPITYAPYFAEYDTYLINGKAFPDTEPIFVKTGEVLRIRLINAGEEVHAMHLHGHHMYITHKDGYRVPLIRQLGDKAAGLDSEDKIANYALASDTILIGPGERYDAYVFAENPGPWHMHDHISLNEMNDYINPGGMMTMLCYEDGWANAQKCMDGHKHGFQGGNYTSGDLIMQMDDYLRKLAGVDPVDGAGDPVTTTAPSTSVPSVNGSTSSVPSSTTSGLPIPSLPAQHIH
jgi:manganese oxidase